MNADLIIHNAGQLVTCASEGGPKRGGEMLDVGIVEDGAVAIVEDKFAAVGTTREILREYQSDEMIDAEGRDALTEDTAKPRKARRSGIGDSCNRFIPSRRSGRTGCTSICLRRRFISFRGAACFAPATSMRRRYISFRGAASSTCYQRR